MGIIIQVRELNINVYIINEVKECIDNMYQQFIHTCISVPIDIYMDVCVNMCNVHLLSQWHTVHIIISIA